MPAAIRRSSLRLRPDPEREQQHRQHEKPEHQPDLAALPQAPAADRGGTGRETPPSPAPRRSRRRGGARNRRARCAAASAMASGWCVATTTRPPAARCAGDRRREPRLAVARRARAVGSSSSQIGAGAAISRARARRRRWPADSQRHGQSATALERRTRRAPRRSPGAALRRATPPRSPASRARLSAGLMASRWPT